MFQNQQRDNFPSRIPAQRWKEEGQHQKAYFTIISDGVVPQFFSEKVGKVSTGIQEDEVVCVPTRRSDDTQVHGISIA